MFIPTEQYQLILAIIPIMCVDVLIVHDNKCLLLKRDNEPAKDTYWFPGGRIYKMETILEAALRKAKEETNLDCVFERIISTEESIFRKNEDMLTDVHTVNICCLMNVQNIQPLTTDSLHNGYIWTDKLDASWHPAVVHPLSLLGYEY